MMKKDNITPYFFDEAVPLFIYKYTLLTVDLNKLTVMLHSDSITEKLERLAKYRKFYPIKDKNVNSILQLAIDSKGTELCKQIFQDEPISKINLMTFRPIPKEIINRAKPNARKYKNLTLLELEGYLLYVLSKENGKITDAWMLVQKNDTMVKMFKVQHSTLEII